ncbi:MAG TPA: GNAT family N-acetyltransferase [Candidatus Limnocylindrales bacterium]|nr:GNAT family N-acetyltransferase [Candidatus Limnocylindrales bacterium]
MGSRPLTDPAANRPLTDPAANPGRPLGLRPATAADADLLLAWANDPSVRAASLQSDPIDRGTHVAWLASRLASDACRIWIGVEPGGRAVGVIRFERDDDGRAVVSISVDRDARGRGYGATLLALGLAASAAALEPAGYRAWVRPGNAASLAMFERAGFRRVEPGSRADVVELIRDAVV